MPPIIPSPLPLFFGGSGIIEGQIVDAKNRRGISGAVIYLKEAGFWYGDTGTGGYLPERAVYETDESGLFRIEGLRDRRYHLDVEAPGFLTFLALAGETIQGYRPRPFFSDDDYPGPSEISSGHWNLKWAPSTPGYELLSTAYPLIDKGATRRLMIYLRRGQRLRGVVKDSEGRPIRGAQVTVLSQKTGGFDLRGGVWESHTTAPVRPTTCKPDGSFLLALAPGTSVTLRFSAPDRPEERRSVDLLSQEGPLEVTLRGGRTLRGRVLNAPDRDIRVAAFEPKAGGRAWQTTTGSQGAFSLDGMVGDRWVVVASATPLGGAVAQMVTDLAIPLNLELRDVRMLEGRVVDPSGKPLADAFVSQVLVLKHKEFTAELSDIMRSEEGLVKAEDDGTLRVPVEFQTSFSPTDAEGGFRMETVLDQGGQVRLRAHMRDGMTAHGWAEAWLPLEGPAGTLVIGEKSSPKPAEGPKLGSAEGYLAQFQSGDLALRRKLIVEIRHEVRVSPERIEFMPLFLAGLSDSDHEVRTQSILGLGELRHPQTFDRLVEALKHEDWTVKHYAIWAISRLGSVPELKERAIAVLRQLMKEEESNQLRVAAAWLLLTLGDSVEPEIFFEALRGDDDPDTCAIQALQMLGRKDAIELLIEALKRSSFDHYIQPALQTLTGDSEKRTGGQWKSWFEEHRGSFPPQVPIEIEPRDAKGWRKSAHRAYKKGDAKGAIERYSRALELDPKDSGALAWRGFIQWELEKLQEALGDFDKCLELDPKEPGNWLHRAYIKAKLKDRSGARSDVEKALSLSPPNWSYRESAERLLMSLSGTTN